MNGREQAPLFVGADVGTTGAKALVADSTGRILGETAATYDVLTPQPLWAEQWPDVWLDGFSRAMRDLIEKVEFDASSVAALTVSSLYGGSGIPVDENFEPVRPCLIWMDRRADQEAEEVRQRVDTDRFVAITGNGIDPYYGFTKILWIKHHEPEAWKRTTRFVPPNSYINYKLTGTLAVDHTSAGNIGGVYDIQERRWSDETCQMLDIPADLLPERLVESTDIVGKLHGKGAAMTGLAEGTPVCAGGVDAAVATLSAGVFDEGPHVAMMGTSMCWGFVHPGSPTKSGLVSMPYVLDPSRLVYTFGGAATAGAVPAWFRDEFGGVERAVEEWTRDLEGLDAYGQLDARAAEVPPGSDGLLVLPYFMGERSPIWDSNARGTITGLTLYHTRAHVYRACLEGVAFALRHNIESGIAAGYDFEELLHIVGGATKSKTWLQIFSDITGRQVAAFTGGEAAYGDAMLAAIGSETATPESLKEWVSTADRALIVEPDEEAQSMYNTMYTHYIGLYHDLKERFRAMADAHSVM